MPYKDMIDPASVRIVNSFGDMMQWKVTAGITRVELRSGRGVVVHYTDASPVWPDFHLDNDPTFGLVRATLCAGFQIGGVWYLSGFMNYWAHGTHEGGRRTDSGAHPLEPATEGPKAGTNNWQANWAYGGWGPLDTYVPRAGDLMAIMLSAGGTRQSKTRTVNERTQIVTVPLQLAGEWDFKPDGVDQPPVDPPPPPLPDADLEQRLVALSVRIAALEHATAPIAWEGDVNVNLGGFYRSTVHFRADQPKYK